jgi:hypothetical protein
MTSSCVSADGADLPPWTHPKGKMAPTTTNAAADRMALRMAESSLRA